MKKFKLFVLAACSPLILVPAVAMAIDGQTEADKTAAEQRAEDAKKAEEQKREEAKKAFEAQREEAKKKAEEQKKSMEDKREAFKKACENHRENFKDRMENVSERTKKRWETADKIVERVKSFVSNKNLAVPNYEQLLADVEAKREALKTAHELTKENIPSFNCEKEKGEVKTSVQTYKDAMAKEIEARKAYKDAIKALINAVKLAAEAAKPEDNSNGQ